MISRVYQWLYLGDCGSGCDNEILKYLSIRTTVNVHREHSCTNETEVNRVQIPLVEAPGNKWRSIVRILDVLDDRRIQGSVLVHCCGGISRSPFVVLCFMVVRKKVSFQRALERLSQLHPITRIDPHLIAMLQRNEAEVKI
ncbi:MAG: dual specificity protein phosphatase family protein [Nitrososphaerales archaeon]